MSTVIRLDVMIREALSKPYTNLVTRPTGAAVRNRVIAVLRGESATDAELDFSRVDVMDYSCADEVVAKLLVATLEWANPRLILKGLRDNHIDAIEAALERYDLVMIAIVGDPSERRLLGRAAEDWRSVVRALDRLGRSAAMPVATWLDWPEARSSGALNELARRRCVVAHPDATYELGAVA